MVKCFVALRRKKGMSEEDFRSHWKNIHAPLVAKLPGIVKYTQHHVTSIPRQEYDNTDEPIDGIVETWWESQEALFKVQGTPELATVLQDELNFLGHSNHFVHTLLVTESVEVVSPKTA
jgi:uncharacterized protein (TIGR02118 family)